MCGKKPSAAAAAPAPTPPPPPPPNPNNVADRGSSAPTTVNNSRRLAGTDEEGVLGGSSGGPAPVVMSVLGG